MRDEMNGKAVINLDLRGKGEESCRWHGRG